jgi:hypothetical protein
VGDQTGTGEQDGADVGRHRLAVHQATDRGDRVDVDKAVEPSGQDLSPAAVRAGPAGLGPGPDGGREAAFDGLGRVEVGCGLGRAAFLNHPWTPVR